MWQFVPETLIPMLISAIWSWKWKAMTDALKWAKKIKEAKKVEWEAKLSKKVAEDIKKVDILEFNFWFRGLEVKINQAHTDIQRLIHYSDETYLFGKKWRVDKFIDTIDDLAFYLNNKAWEIVNSWLHNDIKIALRQLSNKLDDIARNPKLPADLKKELWWILKNELYSARNKI